MLEIVVALALAYLVIGFALGLIILIFNPTGEPWVSDRVLLAYFYIFAWGVIWLFDDELF